MIVKVKSKNVDYSFKSTIGLITVAMMIKFIGTMIFILNGVDSNYTGKITLPEIIMKTLNLIMNNISNHLIFYIIFQISQLQNIFIS